ncbi:MAG TPA: glycosyltransferase family 2 protein [Candidatus Paceibacterota bacterium]|jgi:glycosyltransferase involved in cell wall biosynthesis|nr:glycosyltransferase family 2 protein [Candidatus Paceibacterota bacterium]
MKLSFVIPAYNEENYIGDCLDAILRETRGAPYDTEIIVVDNASTDGTAAAVAKYPEAKLVREPQKGIVKARRAGYLAATGDLIANVDADTRITPGWVKKVMDAFAKDPKLVALSGPFIYYDVSWKVRAVTRFFYYFGFSFYLMNRFVFRVGSMLQGGNFVVRRSGLEAIGGYNAALDFYGEDADIARRMNKVGKVRFTFKLPAYSSGRRLSKDGSITMGIRYALNYFWMIFFKKPFTMTSTDIRPTSAVLLSPAAVSLKPENRTRQVATAVGAVIIFTVMLLVAAYVVYDVAATGTVSTVKLVDWGLQARQTFTQVESSTASMLQGNLSNNGQ